MNTEDQPKPVPGGFAQLPKGLVILWPRLPEHFRLVLVPLLSFMPDCRPSQKLLATLTLRSRRNVNKTLAQMADVGLVTVTQLKREKDKGDWVCRYDLANVDDENVRAEISAKLPQRTRKNSCSSQAPLRTTTVPTPCELQQFSPPVNSRSSYPVRTATVPTNGLLNGQENLQKEELGAGAAPVPAHPLRESGKAETVPHASNSTVEAVGKDRTDAKPKDGKLTPLEIDKACSSFEAMTRYLLYGRKGLHESGELPPGRVNWRRHFVEKDPMIANWRTNEFMGYYWWLVCMWRDQHKIKLTLPSWTRLAGDISNLLDTMPNWDLFKLIGCIVQYFDLIKFMTGKAGLTLTLDHTSLSHGMIRGTAIEIMNMDKPTLEALLLKRQHALQRAA